MCVCGLRMCAHAIMRAHMCVLNIFSYNITIYIYNYFKCACVIFISFKISICGFMRMCARLRMCNICALICATWVSVLRILHTIVRMHK